MFHIFISYANEDGHSYREAIIKLLEENGFQKDDYWYDKRDIALGEEWRSEIDKALNESFLVIIVLTKGAINSHSVTYEWSRAISDGIKVIPVLFEDLNDLPEKLKHPLFSYKQYVGWKETDTPKKLIKNIKQYRRTTPDYRYLNNQIAKTVNDVRILGRLALWLYSYSLIKLVDDRLAKQEIVRLVESVDQTSERLLEILINHSQVFISKQKINCRELIDNLNEFSLKFKHPTYDSVNDRFTLRNSLDDFQEIEQFRREKIEPLLNYFVDVNGTDNYFYDVLNKCLSDISAKQSLNGQDFMLCRSAIYKLLKGKADQIEKENIIDAIERVSVKLHD